MGISGEARDREGVWKETGIVEKFEGHREFRSVGVSLLAVATADRVSLMDASMLPIDLPSRNRSNAFTVLIGRQANLSGPIPTLVFTRLTTPRDPVRL